MQFETHNRLLTNQQTNKKPVADLERRKWGLGISIHIKMTIILSNMQFVTIHKNPYVYIHTYYM